MTVHVLGVRHHSPACARVAAWLLDEVQPSTVLIEGPSDFNERIDELCRLDHELPVALFHFRGGGGSRRASYTPFCDTSPEWVALRWAAKAGACVRFMDLPSHSDAFFVSENRTADRVDRYAEAMRALCERLSVDGSDAAWDHLFEQPDTPANVRERLDRYFHEIRPPGHPAPGRDTEREAFMAQCIAWASERPGDVVAVCGGFHKSALEEGWPTAPTTWPEPPPRSTDNVGTYVVPWSFERLDSFTGYAAGMPSPGWYQALWEQEPAAGAEAMLAACIEALRARKQPVSPADHIAVHVQLRGLMALRGHTSPTRIDVLDALCSALVKGALDVPPPWTRRGPPLAGTDPHLAVIVQTLRGRRVGRIHPGTPRPPLVQDVHTQLEAHDLVPTAAPRTVQLDLDDAADLQRSRILHRLRVLSIPGFRRAEGPEDPTSTTRSEQWALRTGPRLEPALLEASQWGPILEDAARARIAEAMEEADRLDERVSLLVDGLFIGIDELAEEILGIVQQAVASERDPGTVARAVRLLLAVWRHRSAFVPAAHPVVGDVLQALMSRTIQIASELRGGAHRDHLGFGIAARDLLRHGPVDGHDRGLALATLRRRVSDPVAPIDLRGAALGILHDAGDDQSERASLAVRGVALEHLGDWLAGLFAVTRETLGRSTGLLDAVHERIADLGVEPFLEALPALRLAFAWFPPAEREALGAALLQRLGRGDEALQLAATDVAEEAAGLALEQRVEALLAQHRLLGGEA